MPEKQKINSNAKINPTTKIIYPAESTKNNKTVVDVDNSNDHALEQSISEDELSNPQTTVSKNFREKLVKFIKIDDIIREETLAFKEKLETLKIQKEELSSYIMRYLDDGIVIDLENKGKVSKYTSTRKSGINKDIIQQSIYEKLKNENLVGTDAEGERLAQATYDIMEGKRKVTTKITLKRTIKKEKKQKPEKEIQKVQEVKQIEQIDKKPRKVNK
jgi:hypothetical protein